MTEIKTLQISSANSEFFEEQVRVLEEKGIQCDVVCATSRSTETHSSGDSLKDQILNNIYGHNPLYYFVKGSSFYFEVQSLINKNDYDVIHANSGMVAPFGLLASSTPVFVTFWGDDLLGDRLYGYYPRISKFCARHADHVFVRSEEMRQKLTCDSTILPSGVDMNKFKQINKSRARYELGWEQDRKCILFPYAPSQEKKRFPVAKEITSELNGKIDKKVELKDIQDVPHGKMYMYYSAADVLLLPSLREGSPNTVKEAMACNLPVVSTDVGDVDKRLKDVFPSAVCENVNEMTEAVQSILLQDRRSNGRKHVEEVSWHNISQTITSHYKQSLERNRS